MPKREKKNEVERAIAILESVRNDLGKVSAFKIEERIEKAIALINKFHGRVKKLEWSFIDPDNFDDE